jgi:hypothetical protein
LDTVSRFSAVRLARWSGFPKTVQVAFYAVGAAIVAALVFQFFFRYQYVEKQGVLWRVDRLTQQTCRLSTAQPGCAAASPSTSLSTSTALSTSTSTSVTVKILHPNSK